jgi:hypothetical protein
MALGNSSPAKRRARPLRDDRSGGGVLPRAAAEETALRGNGPPLISVVIPNYNGAVLLERCLASLAVQDFWNHEVLVVDNASADGSVDVVTRTLPQARILRQDRNLGFAGAANAGIAAARGRWVAVLNNDTEVSESWLSQCAAAMERHPDAAFFACRILEHARPGLVYSAGDCFLRAGIGYRRGQGLPDGAAYDSEAEVFSPGGCAALYRKSAFEEAGGYDERFFAYLEDVELGLRMQARGLVGYYVPEARLLHHGAATSGGEFSPLSVRLRTRNALLLIMKSLPVQIIGRCLPGMLAAQFVWLARIIRRGRILSYVRGLAQAMILGPAMLRSRRVMREYWSRGGTERLWQSILRSESMASLDYRGPHHRGPSLFLRWYFRRRDRSEGGA